MKRPVVVALALAAVLGGLSLGAAPAVAQWHADSNPLPNDEFFGDGWEVLRADGPSETSAGTVAGAVYGGPRGARVVAILVAHDGSGGAARRAWEGANDVYDALQGDIDYDYMGDDELADEPPPAGCADARRGAGAERMFGANLPVGMTLCAADPGEVYLVLVSGEAFGVTGVAASDSAVQRLVAGRNLGSMAVATPKP